MSSAIRLPPSLKSPKPRTILRDPPRAFPLNLRSFPISTLPLYAKSLFFPQKIRVIQGRNSALSASSEEGYLQELDDDSPVSVELLPLCSETQFDQIIAEAQQLQQPVILVWIASWCRKCIYLKPKLEKLAADFYPRLRFYCVDVNAVPHKLVVRAGVTKMPTIQLWKDALKQAEVIGGHKAYLVINEIREMIENE